MIHFTHVIIMNNIIHFILFHLDDYGNSIDGDLVHETFQVEEVCGGWILVEGRNRRQYCDQ